MISRSDVLDVSAAIFVDDGRVLCFKRGVSKYPYLSYRFEFPGGKVEDGETPDETIVRELKEELDVEVIQSELIPFRNTVHDYPDFTVRMHFFIIDGNPGYTLKEHCSAVWADADALPQLDWVDADREILQSLRGYLE